MTRIINQLSTSEIVMLLMIDPNWTLPLAANNSRARMLAAYDVRESMLTEGTKAGKSERMRKRRAA